MQNDIILYTTPDGFVSVQVQFEDSTFWLTQKRMAELFGVDVRTVNEHLQNIYKSNELDKEATIRKFRIVQQEGARSISRELDFYHLDAIIAVGYRVNSYQATQFRIWATNTLRLGPVYSLTSGYRVLLASNSPRRRELLGGLNIPFEVVTLPDVDESYPPHLVGEEIPLYISRKKSEAYRPFMDDDTLLITADTIVWLDGKVFGKPEGHDDARRMLRALSGKTHQVITGVTLAAKGKERSFTALSEVTFAPLEDDEIDYYLDHYQPYDKAGSYGVQEWIGYISVEHIEGSYFNVMGLPIQRLYRELKRFAG